MASYPPSGLDVADGVSGQPGTPTPTGAVVVAPDTFYLEELPDSPEIERAEQATIRHRFKCDFATGKDLISAYGRGLILEDASGNITQVLSASLNHDRGGASIFSVTAEGKNFDTPPDDFDVDEIELNLPLAKHPRYRSVLKFNLDDSGDVVDPTLLTGFQILLAIEQAIAVPQVEAQDENVGLLNPSNVPDADVLGLAEELLSKRRRGEETWYLAGRQIRWDSFYRFPPPINPGGYTEDPITQGGLPPYFWSDDGTAGGNNIFDMLDGNNPEIWGNGTVWLRKADRVRFQRTWFMKSRTWVGAPKGDGPTWTAVWDSDIYPDATLIP